MRWGFLAVGALIWLTVLSLVPGIVLTHKARKALALAAAILLAGGWVADAFRIRSENRAAVALEVPTGWINASLAKRRALQWGLAAGTNQWRMIGLATEAPMLYYFAGIQTVASYYWENNAGWHAETAWFADQTPGGKQARQIARERGLTHAFAKPNDSLPRLYLTIQCGAYDPALLPKTMAGRLAGASAFPLSPWIHRDDPLSAIAHHPYTFQTPEGLIGEYTVGQVFQLEPDETPDEPRPEQTPD